MDLHSTIHAFQCSLQDTIAIIQLLVAIAVHFRAPVRFPEYVSAQILVVQKKDNRMKSYYITEQLTTTQPELGVKVNLRFQFSCLIGRTTSKLTNAKPITVSANFTSLQ